MEHSYFYGVMEHKGRDHGGDTRDGRWTEQLLQICRHVMGLCTGEWPFLARILSMLGCELSLSPFLGTFRDSIFRTHPRSPSLDWSPREMTANLVAEGNRKVLSHRCAGHEICNDGAMLPQGILGGDPALPLPISGDIWTVSLRSLSPCPCGLLPLVHLELKSPSAFSFLQGPYSSVLELAVNPGWSVLQSWTASHLQRLFSQMSSHSQVYQGRDMATLFESYHLTHHRPFINKQRNHKWVWNE